MNSPSDKNKNSELYLKIALVLVLAALVVLCALLVGQYRHIQTLGYIPTRGTGFGMLHMHQPLTVNDASSTQSWMTFDYINRIFGLPPQYLVTTLTITDSRYPRLTVAQYAASSGIEQSIALKQVIGAIHAYFTPQQ
jgi:hypothetical protein